GALAADVGLRAGDEQSVDAALLEQRAEIGRAGDERAVAVLGHFQIARRDVQLAPGFLQLVARGKRCRRARTVLWSYEHIEKTSPALRLLVQHPDDRHATLPQLARESVDAGT